MKYFDLEEMTHSATAIEYDIDNTPSPEVEKNIELLVDELLDPIREELGLPIYINCCYRNNEINKLVGGSKTSYHLIGSAVDCWCKDNEKLLEIVKKHDFDQIFYYGSWMHIGYRNSQSGLKNRKQFFDKRKKH